MFKKLQENSLYWRYRFVTRRWLALKRTMRSWRQPNLAPIRHRGATLYAPRRTNQHRGIIFVVSLALVLTAGQVFLGAYLTGVAGGLALLAVIVGFVYVFTR